jgi:hypothetical protein
LVISLMPDHGFFRSLYTVVGFEAQSEPRECLVTPLPSTGQLA